MKLVHVCAVVIAGGCADSGPSGRGSERSSVGDTTVVVSSSAVSVDTVADVRVVWRSDELENPVAMARSDDVLVVADAERLHLIDLTTGAGRTVGRAGDGPGEFRSITAVGVDDDGSFLVHDARTLRFTRLDAEGGLIETHRVTPRAPFVNPRHAGDALTLIDDRAILLRQQNLSTRRPTPSALLSHDIARDTSAKLGEWDDLHFVELPGDFVGPGVVYGPIGVFAQSVHGFAVGDGQEYCIDVHRFTSDASALTPPTRVCREWSRAATRDGVRRPDLGVVDNARMREALELSLTGMTVPELMPSYDALLFDEAGRLWVRTVGAELADIHPYVLRRRPDLGRLLRMWDVFDESGELLRSVALPQSLVVKLITDSHAYGFVELESGEIAIGAADIR